jgi:hypothetical protein
VIRRGTRIRWSVVACALCVVLGSAAPSPAATPAQLLARYQPVTVLHPIEVFTPTAVDGFLGSTVLEQRGANGTWAPSEQPPSPLPTSDPPGCTSSAASACWRLDVPSCTPAGGLAAVACYGGLEKTKPPANVVYGAYLPRGDRIALQYWYWYWYDFWSGTRPATDYVWQAHEGDWEVVTVLLDRSEKPLLAGYSQHSCGKRRAWARVPRWHGTTHPLVYVALGSHANYFSPGVQAIDLRQQCYPPAGATILRYLLGEVLEYTAVGRRFGPPAHGVTRQSLVRITAASPQWMAFPGYWGEDNVLHAPDPFGTRDVGPGPAGPVFHALWRDPFGTLLRWPRG